MEQRKLPDPQCREQHPGQQPDHELRIRKYRPPGGRHGYRRSGDEYGRRRSAVRGRNRQHQHRRIGRNDRESFDHHQSLKLRNGGGGAGQPGNGRRKLQKSRQHGSDRIDRLRKHLVPVRPRIHFKQPEFDDPLQQLRPQHEPLLGDQYHLQLHPHRGIHCLLRHLRRISPLRHQPV